jgi:two-component system NtrC family sensor kinase
MELLATRNLDNTEAPSFVRDTTNLKQMDTVKGITKVPLLHGEKTIATITLEPSDHLQPERQDNLLRLYSNHSASVLQNAIFLEQNEDQIRELSETKEKLELVLEHLEAHHNLAMIGLVFGESIHFAGNELGMAKTNARNIIQHVYASDSELEATCEKIIKYIDDYLNVLRDIQDEVMAPIASQINVHVTLDNTLGSKRVSDNIQIAKNYSLRDPRIWAPTRQLRQVFLVILQNALTALNGEGTLTLATKNLTIDGQNFIEVSIADTGPGIPKRAQEDLFKIKPIRIGKRGMQLGLPWAYSFLRTYSGALEFETSETGTVFKIRVPVDWRKAKII